LILDAGFLISVDRGEDLARSFITAAHRFGTALHTTHPVVAQVWRDGSRQARLASFLRTVSVHPFDDGPMVGRILGLSGSADVVDAHIVAVALRLNDDILTGDTDDLGSVVSLLGSAAPTIHRWP
jgi:predicted nucleic acid-binding protein